MYNPNENQYVRYPPPPQSRYRPPITYRNQNPYDQPGSFPDNNQYQYIQPPPSQRQNYPKPYQPKPPSRTYGLEEILDFGKCRGQSCYDIANNGDFKYLKWLNKGAFSGGFQLHGHTVSHIANSLNLEKHKGCKWERKEDENGSWWEFITKNGEIIKGPTIEKSTVLLDH